MERNQPESAQLPEYDPQRQQRKKPQEHNEEEQQALHDRHSSPWPPDTRPYKLPARYWDTPQNNTGEDAGYDKFNQKWLNILEKAYNEPHRHYHTLGHIMSMKDILADTEREVHHPWGQDLFTDKNMHIMGLAIWFHDVVYDVTKTIPGYNEIESALMFYEYAKEAGPVFSSRNRDIIIGVLHLILATITHEMPTFPSAVCAYDDNKTVKAIIDMVSIPDLCPEKILIQLFLDVDVSILGAPEEKYNTYAKQIRKEYSSYSWEEYRKGRIKVMTSFLQRERIFLTDHFHATYEQQARDNIQRELNSLQNGDDTPAYSNVM